MKNGKLKQAVAAICSVQLHQNKSTAIEIKFREIWVDGQCCLSDSDGYEPVVNPTFIPLDYNIDITQNQQRDGWEFACPWMDLQRAQKVGLQARRIHYALLRIKRARGESMSIIENVRRALSVTQTGYFLVQGATRDGAYGSVCRDEFIEFVSVRLNIASRELSNSAA